MDDWPLFNAETELQDVLNNTDDDALVVIEKVTIPKPSKRATAHWSKLADSSAGQNMIFSVLICSIYMFNLTATYLTPRTFRGSI